MRACLSSLSRCSAFEGAISRAGCPVVSAEKRMQTAFVSSNLIFLYARPKFHRVKDVRRDVYVCRCLVRLKLRFIVRVLSGTRYRVFVSLLVSRTCSTRITRLSRDGIRPLLALSSRIRESRSRVNFFRTSVVYLVVVGTYRSLSRGLPLTN